MAKGTPIALLIEQNGKIIMIEYSGKELNVKILLKYPTTNRPALFKKRIENWSFMAKCTHRIDWLCSFDENDPTMNTPEVHEWLISTEEKLSQRNIGLSWHYGNSRTKIEACNADMNMAPPFWRILVLVSDDMAVTEWDWDDSLAGDYCEYYPNYDGCLWYTDGRQDRLCTLSILGRPIYDELGYVYDPDFISTHCDDWFQFLMEKKGKIRRMDRQWFVHEWMKENADWLMRRNNNPVLFQQDKATLARKIKEYTYNNSIAKTGDKNG